MRRVLLLFVVLSTATVRLRQHVADAHATGSDGGDDRGKAAH